MGNTTRTLICLLTLVAAGSGVAAAEEPLAATDLSAPEFVGGPWLNTAGHAPVTLASRRGEVTVVEFWTFGCINCRRNLPIYARWHKRFANQGVTIIGVHTPETPTERVAANVAARVKDLGIEYPVLLDADLRNWNRWRQQYWPTTYLVDKHGRIRYRWEGELNFGRANGEARMTELIEQLLREK